MFWIVGRVGIVQNMSIFSSRLGPDKTKPKEPEQGEKGNEVTPYPDPDFGPKFVQRLN